MRRLVPFALSVLALVPAARAEAPASKPQVVRHAMPRSVRIQVFSHGELRRSGSGVVVVSEAKDGKSHAEVLTNAHVADPSELKDVTYAVLVEKHAKVEKTLPARLVAIGQVPDLDLAILEVDEALPAAELAQEDQIDVGDEVVVVGAPYGKSLSVSGGMVSQIEADDQVKDALRFKAMKTDAAIGYGSSGGGVFSVPGGRLVGIVEGYRTARVSISERMAFDVPMPGETFIAPITKVRKFLSDHLGAKALGTGTMEAAANLPKVPAVVMPKLP